MTDSKKYRISKFYVGVYIAGLFFILPLVLIGVFVECQWYYRVVLLTIGGLGTAAGIYQMVFDFPTGTFSLDETGITMYIGFKSHFMSWSDCKSFGIADVNVEQTASTFWVYCATRPLTYMEKKHFLSKTRRDLKLVHYFQYSEEPFEEMLKYIPADQAERLKAEVDSIRMNWIEKLYHRK